MPSDSNNAGDVRRDGTEEPPAWLDEFKGLSSISQIDDMYESMCQQEAAVDEELTALRDQQQYLDAKMNALQNMMSSLQVVYSDAEHLSHMIGFTSTLAENISYKVRQLDLAKTRVTECLQRVEDILDLKFCTDGIQTALKNEDYEQAAAHIHRFLSLDESVLKRSAADITEGSSLEEAFARLHAAERELKSIVMHKFDEAVKDEDVASVERFFKIFPLLNQHAEGLKKFSTYLCSQIAETAQKNLKSAQSVPPGDKRYNLIYADTATLLFEGIARVVEVHQPLVETYYGMGRLLSVLEILQKECDRQAKRIIDDFRSARQLQKMAGAVQAALKHSHQRALTDKIDPRDIDALLSEMTLLNARAELYIRFIRRRATADIEVAWQEEDVRREKLSQVDRLVRDCGLSRQMQEILSLYITMEEFFMRESVNKAVALEVAEAAPSTSLTSDVVDDVFFIIKKCIRRSLASANMDVACAMLNNAGSLLDEDFRSVMSDRLRQGFQSGMLELGQAAYSVIQGAGRGGRQTEHDRARSVFLTTLNNLELTCQYINTLKKNLEEEIFKAVDQISDQERAKLDSCLSDFTDSTSRFQNLLKNGLVQLCSNAVKPRVKPWVEAFQASNHILDEEEFAQYEATDGIRPPVQNFVVNLDALLRTFRDALTPGNYDMLVALLAAEITSQLETAVLRCSFNSLGGLQFEKDLRALVGYLTSVTTWTIRDKFARLTQTATILGLDKVTEVLDYCGPSSGSLTWRLTPNEVRHVLSLRTDFRAEDIKRLKL